MFVNIRPFKQWAKRELKEDSVLRRIILSEKDILEGKVFYSKAEIWYEMVKTESAR